MNRASRLWLAAGAVVVIGVLAVVVVFGIRTLPAFPSLYDGGPTVEGSVAYVEQGRDTCVDVLDVATGTSRQVYCAPWLWLEGWNEDGYLIVQSGDGGQMIIDPETGTVVGATDNDSYRLVRSEETLRISSSDGRVTVNYTGAGDAVTLIDVAGPRDYFFRASGITADRRYGWVCDTADRLVVVALDGSGGPWLVAEDIAEPAWR